MAVAGLLEQGVAAGLVGAPESGKSLLALNIAACVATGHDFHGRACASGLVVYLCGEGHHGIARRLQAIENRYSLGLVGAPLVVSKQRAPLLNESAVMGVRAAIEEAQSEHGSELVLLVVDTLARFIAPGDESKAQDMGAALNAIDFLRNHTSTCLILHHPGHGAEKRGRGSSDWRGALDAEYYIELQQDVTSLEPLKMKDGERPQPLAFRIEQEITNTLDEAGVFVRSVVLAPTALTITRPDPPAGKNQGRLYDELERRSPDRLQVWTDAELKQIGRDIGLDRWRAREAVKGLRTHGLIVPTVGGSHLVP